jgi:hypothetical protein
VHTEFDIYVFIYINNKMNCELMLTYDTPALRQTGSRNRTGQKTLPTYMHIFRHIFLSNYWWQRSDIWSQASYRYHISWEAAGFMVLNATFNNISVMSWRSVLLVEETGVPGEHHRPVTSHWHNVVSRTPCHERGSNSQLLVFTMYVRVYLQGSENGRVVTIAKWFLCSQLHNPRFVRCCHDRMAVGCKI